MGQFGIYSKKAVRGVRFIPLFIVMLIAYSQQGLAGNEVRVKVTGMSQLEGTLRATLDGSEGAFTNDMPTTQTCEQEVVAKEMELVFHDVPPGKYAIKIIHDQNNDKKLNVNILGIPAEKYGISNNVKGKFGLPAFSDASFEVGSDDLDLAITVSKHTFF